ncbi:MAG: tetratricopeptide repeat protein, partial [Rhodospirillales bacterium]|nr:tetratricopeptide repeat protein [Rhodospirillales bacterium]
ETAAALGRALEQAAPAARRARQPGPPPSPAPKRPRWSPMRALRARGAIWRPRLARAGRFGLFYVAPVAVVVVVGALVLREMRHVGVIMMPLSVPAVLADSGRTPEVLARQLADQVDQVRRLTLADRTDRPDDAFATPLPRVQLPPPAWSRQGIAARLRDLFGAPVERVSGDIVQRPDGKLSLRLHMTGAGEIAARDGIAPADIDANLAAVAGQVWRVAAPTLYAWYIVGTEQRPAKVLAILQALLKDPTTGRTLTDPAARQAVTVLLARAEVRAGDSRGALATIEGLGTAGNLYAPAAAVRALALLDMGDMKGANDAEDRVLALAPGQAWAHASAARFYLSIGRFNEAYQQARAARRIAPDDGAAAILESAGLIALKRVPEAVEVARQAVQRFPAQPGVQEALGNALMAARRPDLALGLFDSELKLHPDRVPALIAQARALQQLNRNDEALAATEAALRVSPSNGTAMLLRAWTLLALKRPQDALAAFEALLGSRPDMPMLLQGKAAALAALGRTPEAVAVLQHMQELMPGNPQLEAELERLKATLK